MTYLQVAMDFFKLEDAIPVLEAVSSAGAHIIEIGTPLIHFEGLRKSISVFKRYISDDQLLMADLKIADVGYATARLAYELGADLVSVLARASDETIKGVVNAAKEFNKAVVADLILSKDVSEDIERAIRMGVDYILFHLGIDVQKKLSLAEFIRRFDVHRLNQKIALAGGINLQMLPELLSIKPAIIIVGKAITRSDNPYEAVKKFLQQINSSQQ